MFKQRQQSNNEEIEIKRCRGRPKKAQNITPITVTTPSTEEKEEFAQRINMMETNLKCLNTKWEQGLAEIKFLVTSKAKKVQSSDVGQEIDQPYLSDMKAEVQMQKYINTCFTYQLMNEDLQKENKDLHMKLEKAISKLEKYEEIHQLFYDSVEKIKDEDSEEEE